MDLKKLSEPLPPNEIFWRPVATETRDGKDMCLASAYIKRRAVEARLDEVCSPEGWRVDVELFGEVICVRLYIKTEDGWVGKTGLSQATEQSDDDFAVAGGYTYAFKRAARAWGIGRYLDYAPTVWVPYSKKTKKPVAPPALPDQSMMKLMHTLGTKVYGEAWDTKRAELVRYVTEGMESSSHGLTYDQAERIIKGLEAKQLEVAK